MSQTKNYTLSASAKALTAALFNYRQLFAAKQTAAEPAQSTDQELWITLRFKGYADSLADPRHIANDLLAELQAHLELKYGAISFAISQPGDVMDVEEEADIYADDQNETTTPPLPENTDSPPPTIPSLPSVFTDDRTFEIDNDNSDDTYQFVDVAGVATVAIKREDEGILVEILKIDGSGPPIASAYAFDNEFHTDKEEDHG